MGVNKKGIIYLKKVCFKMQSEHVFTLHFKTP